MPRRGNPTWSQGGHFPIPEDKPTEFEYMVAKLKLTLDNCQHSKILRHWARKYAHKKYVPEELLIKWGIVVDGDQGLTFR